MIPKFRAWDNAEQKMVEEDSILIWGDSVLILDEGHDWNINDLSASEINDTYLMQSTGQKDCNNSDIFDADILLEPWTGHIIGRVFYSSEDLAWKVSLVDGGEECLSDCLDLQVCGNIYENPDLVEAENGG